MKRHILTALAMTTAFGMAAQTTSLVVEEKNGTKTAVPTSGIAGVLFEEAPEYRDAEVLLYATYATSGENGAYTMEFGTDTPDQNGDPTDIEEMQVTLQLIGTQSADKFNAELPEGYYRIGDTSKPFSININASGVRTRLEEGPDGIAFQIFIDGTADVRRNADGEYDIRIEMTAMSGEPVCLRYQGPVDFTVGASEFDSFKEDQNITFTGGQERFYGNWFYPFADDATLQFYTGEFTQEGSQINGFWLNIDSYLPKSEDPMNVAEPLPDGTYMIDTREDVLYRTYNPFSFTRGQTVDFLGQIVQVGSYITLVEKDGHRYLALIREGEFTVSDNGRKIVFDFVDENGNKIQGTYEGRIVLGNFCHNGDSEPSRPYSTVTEDLTLDFTESTVAMCFKEPETFVKGYDTYELYIMDATEDPHKDFLQFTILTEAGKGIENGTFTVSYGFGNNVAVAGRVDYSGLGLFSYYGDYDSTDPDGYQTVIAPLSSGSFTMSDGPDADSKSFTFDLYDDADMGPDGGKAHKISGTWTGTFFFYDMENPEQKPALRVVKK